MEKEYLFVKIEGLKRVFIVKMAFCVVPIIGSHNIVAIPLQMLCKIVANYNHAVYVSKVPWLRVESMALLGTKCGSFGCETMMAVCLNRLFDSAELGLMPCLS